MTCLVNHFSHGVEKWLTDKQVQEFTTLIGIDSVQHNIQSLTKLVQGIYRHIPFQNLTMLTRPKEPPKPNQIIDDMLMGIGGLCNTINPFVAAVLHHFEFPVAFLKVSMMQPDCHIGIVTSINERDYWLDLGNGFPYLHPLEIKHQSHGQVLSFGYQLLQQHQHFKLKQSIIGTSDTKINQTFELTPFDYHQFDEIRQRHYSETNYGPFLTSIRLNRWQLDKGFLLRDEYITPFPNASYRAEREQIITWISQHFNQSNHLIPLIKQSWSLLDEQSHH